MADREDEDSRPFGRSVSFQGGNGTEGAHPRSSDDHLERAAAATGRLHRKDVVVKKKVAPATKIASAGPPPASKETIGAWRPTVTAIGTIAAFSLAVALMASSLSPFPLVGGWVLVVSIGLLAAYVLVATIRELVQR